MISYHNSVINKIDAEGDINAALNSSITVRSAITGVISTIYSDDGVTELSNPFNVDASGNYEFYAPDGVYDITINEGDADEHTIPWVQLYDLRVESTWPTLTDFVSNGRFDSAEEGTVIEFQGYSSKGDGGNGKWYKTSSTGSVSQTPKQIGRAALRDRDGNEWLPVSLIADGVVNALSIGCVGDNSTDNLLALRAGIQDTAVTGFFIPPGKYQYTGSITRTGTSLALYGLSFEDSELIPIGDSTITLNGGDLELYDSATFKVCDLGFRQSGTNTGDVLNVTFANTAGIPSTTANFERVEITGVGSTDIFNSAITLSNPKNVRIDSCRIMGDRDGTPQSSAYGIRIEGEDNPAEVFIDKTTVYFVQDGVSIGGKVEGIYLNQYAAVAVQSGVNMDTSGEIEPLLVIGDSHINARSIGVSMTDTVQYSIHDTLIYGSDGTAFTGVYYRLDVATQAVGKITNCHFENVSISGAFNALNIDATAGTTSVLVDGNTFRNITSGSAIVLGSGTNDVIVTPENYYIGVTSKLNDAGSNYVNMVTRVSFSESIDDDAVLTYAPKFASGMLSVHADGYNNVFSKCYYNTASSVASEAYSGTLASFASGALTGTTGVDGEVTVSADSAGNIYVENRSGATRTFNLIFELSGA